MRLSISSRNVLKDNKHILLYREEVGTLYLQKIIHTYVKVFTEIFHIMVIAQKQVQNLLYWLV